MGQKFWHFDSFLTLLGLWGRRPEALEKGQLVGMCFAFQGCALHFRDVLCISGPRLEA